MPAENASSAPGRRERKKERTRRVLMDVAMALFAERGMYGARVEDITERADVAKGVFYNYFDSKEALVAELLAEGFEVLRRGWFEGVTPVADRVARLAEIARRQGTFYDQHPQYALLLHQARGLLLLDPARGGRLQQVVSDHLAWLGRLLVEGEDVSRWTEREILDVAAAFAGGLTGHRSFAAAAGLGPVRDSSERFLAAGMAALLAGR